jgi:hypothetical protein
LSRNGSFAASARAAVHLGLVAVCAACSGSAPATLRIRVESTSPANAPAYVKLSAYAVHPELRDQRLNGPLPVDRVQAIDDFTPWRVFVWAFDAEDQPVGFGTSEAHPSPSGETFTVVTLGALLTDTDGDGIPDAYDDCPTEPDPDQTGCRPPDGGGTGPDAGTDGAPGQNLVYNPGCEADTVGWVPELGTLTLSPVAHGGSSSCQVCVIAGNDGYVLDDRPNPVTLPRMGEVYHATAFLRETSGVADMQMAVLSLRVHDATGMPAQQMPSAPVLLSESWQQADVMIQVNADGRSLDLQLSVVAAPGASLNPGDCALIDDVSLVRLQ